VGKKKKKGFHIHGGDGDNKSPQEKKWWQVEHHVPGPAQLESGKDGVVRKKKAGHWGKARGCNYVGHRSIKIPYLLEPSEFQVLRLSLLGGGGGVVFQLKYAKNGFGGRGTATKKAQKLWMVLCKKKKHARGDAPGGGRGLARI